MLFWVITQPVVPFLTDVWGHLQGSRIR